MRLHEIVDTAYKVTKTNGQHDLPKMIDNLMANANTEQAGVYAQGSQTSDPFVYQKKNFLPSELKNDGYFNYIRAINPHIKSNPFFPRVYMVELDVDADGLKVPRYEMEKLLKPSHVGQEAVMGLAQNLIHGFSLRDNSLENMWGYLVKLLARYVCGDTSIAEYFTSTKLKQALDLIKQTLASNKNFKCDIHTNNCMVRMTKFGPQLVITDPIEDRVSRISSRPTIH